MKTPAQLEIENAELRGQVKALREMLETMLTKPVVPQFVPIPYPQPTVNPQPWVPAPYDPTPFAPFKWGVTYTGNPYHGVQVVNVPGCSS